MLEVIQGLDVTTMRFRERIAAAVRVRIEVNVPYREALRRTLSFLALPPNTPLAIKSTWGTVDAIWYACGDTSTDLSFYSKRATLAAVYGATVLYWLDDSSEQFVDTWAFLERRIDDVMQIPKVRKRVEEAVSAILRPPPFRHQCATSS
jgi:ubiquinone biosynthesis protein COQ9